MAWMLRDGKLTNTETPPKTWTWQVVGEANWYEGFVNDQALRRVPCYDLECCNRLAHVKPSDDKLYRVYRFKSARNARRACKKIIRKWRRDYKRKQKRLGHFEQGKVTA